MITVRSSILSQSNSTASMNSHTEEHAKSPRDNQSTQPSRDPVRTRSFSFALSVVKLCKFLERRTDVSRHLIDQMLRAGTSIGANLEEAKAAESRADFIHKNAISLKEARESNFWLRLILSTEEFDEVIRQRIEEIESESIVLAKIIAKIIVQSKKK